MANLTTPILYNIPAFDSQTDSCIVKWGVLGGEQIIGAIITIASQDGATLYLNKVIPVTTDIITTDIREFSYALSGGDLSALTNGQKYQMTIRTTNSALSLESRRSNMILLQCYTAPIFSIGGILSGEEINTPTLALTLNYSQAEGELLNYYTLQLFGEKPDSTEEIIAESGRIYQGQEYTLRNYPMPNNTDGTEYIGYYILAKGETLGGTILTYQINNLQMRKYYINLGQDRFSATNLCESGTVQLDCSGVSESDYLEGKIITIPNTVEAPLSGQLSILGETVGGGGTPAAPIEIVSPTSPIDLTVCGKNLFDIGGLINNAVSQRYNNGLTLTKSAAGRFTNNIPMSLPAGTYRLSYDIIDKTTAGPIGRQVQYIDGTYYSIPGKGVCNFTKEVKLIHFYAQLTDAEGTGYTIDNIQLEKGSTATSYEAYNGTDYSIPLKDTNGNDLTLRKVETAYDSVYKENGKWYAQIKIAKATSNVTNAKPNSAYIGTTGNGTASGTGAITVTGEVIYELETPEIKELHADTANALEHIYLQNGLTNLFSLNTPQPYFQYINFEGLMTGKYQIKRRQPHENRWITLQNYTITSPSDLKFTLQDTYNATNTTYQYALVPINPNNTEGTYLTSQVDSNFSGAYLCDSSHIYSIYNELSYSGYETTQRYGVAEPFGSKYPIVETNATLKYDSGTIEFNLRATADKGDINRPQENALRNAVSEFVTNKKAKIIKDYNGNIWLVKTPNSVSYSFLKEMGNGVASPAVEWYQIGDENSQTDLEKFGMLDNFEITVN